MNTSNEEKKLLSIFEEERQKILKKNTKLNKVNIPISIAFVVIGLIFIFSNSETSFLIGRLTVFFAIVYLTLFFFLKSGILNKQFQKQIYTKIFQQFDSDLKISNKLEPKSLFISKSRLLNFNLSVKTKFIFENKNLNIAKVNTFDELNNFDTTQGYLYSVETKRLFPNTVIYTKSDNINYYEESIDSSVNNKKTIDNISSLYYISSADTNFISSILDENIKNTLININDDYNLILQLKDYIITMYVGKAYENLLIDYRFKLKTEELKIIQEEITTNIELLKAILKKIIELDK